MAIIMRQQRWWCNKNKMSKWLILSRYKVHEYVLTVIDRLCTKTRLRERERERERERARESQREIEHIITLRRKEGLVYIDWFPSIIRVYISHSWLLNGLNKVLSSSPSKLVGKSFIVRPWACLSVEPWSQNDISYRFFKTEELGCLFSF